MKISIVIFLMFLNYQSLCQYINITTGLSQSSTLHRIAFKNAFGRESFNEAKNGLSIAISYEKLLSSKSAFDVGLSYCKSGGKLAVYETSDIRPNALWKLTNDKYTIPYLGLFGNYYMTLARANSLSLDALVGIHADLIVRSFDEDDSFFPTYDETDPLQTWENQGALNKFNFGPNFGLRLKYDFEKYSFGLQLTSAPKVLKLASYRATKEEINNMNSGVIGIDVKEKNTFINFTFGYKLSKQNK